MVIQDNILLLLFTRNFFEIEIDLSRIDFLKVATFLEIKHELNKFKIRTFFSNIYDICGNGYCVVDISTTNAKSFFLFCEFNTVKDKFICYDFNNKISYYCNKEVFISLVTDRQCLLFFDTNAFNKIVVKHHHS